MLRLTSMSRRLTLALATAAIAACGTSKSAEKPAEKPEVKDPEQIGLAEILRGGTELPQALAEGDEESELSRQLAIAMGGERQEVLEIRHGPDEPGDDSSIDEAPASRRRFGTIVVGAPVVRGTCDASRIARAIRLRAGALRACYEQRLQVEATLAGEVALELRLDGAAAVSDVKASGMSDEPTMACLERAVRRTRFEPDDRNCAIEIGLTFAPEPP